MCVCLCVFMMHVRICAAVPVCVKAFNFPSCKQLAFLMHLVHDKIS